MTKEEILAMESGVKLDYLVATKVMGYQPDKHRDGWVRLGELSMYPKRYSTDISEAWKVIEVMKKRYFSEIAMCQLDNGAWGWMARFILAEGEPYWTKGYRAVAETAPEAICKAASMAALEEEGA